MSKPPKNPALSLKFFLGLLTGTAIFVMAWWLVFA